MLLSLETIREYCLRMNGTITEETPFGEEVLVFKVEGKVFLLTVMDKYPLSINLKCEPEHAIELRERYDAVQPVFHMHKKHWNTVTIDNTIPHTEILRMIDHSYEQVVLGLPKAVRKKLDTPR